MQRLRDLRQQNNLSQRALAAKLGISQKSIDNWENGSNTANVAAAVKIADYFGCSVDYLLGRSDEPKYNE